MTLDEIAQMLKNRLAQLRAARQSAFDQGAIANVETLDNDIRSTTTSLESLRSILPDVME